MAATIKDISRLTGLSLATISKFLNGGRVRPENREKIEAAIGELHYEVNEIARGLATKKTQTIGVVVFGVENMFCGELIKYIGGALRKLGYGLLICDSNHSARVEAENIGFLLSKLVAGIIVVPASNDPAFLEPARRAGVPVVLLDRALPGDSYDCVRINNIAAAKKAVGRLLENGHKKIAVIGSDERLYTGRERVRGYREAMAGAGLEPPEAYLRLESHSMEHGYLGMKELLALPDPPTAVFITNYEMTLGAVIALNESGAACPEQLSIMAFDDLLLDQIVRPKLHTVVQPMQEMAEKAVAVLIDRIRNGGGPPAELVFGTTIKEGNSIKKISE